MTEPVISEWPAQIGHPTMRFYWTVNLDRADLVWFRVSQGQCGIDPLLRIDINECLECVFRRWSPAHTQVLFNYSGVVPGDIFAGVDDLLPIV